MHTTKRWAIAIILIVLIAFICGALFSTYIALATTREEELLSWTDSNNLQYSINARYFIAKTVTELTVSDEEGVLKKIMLDDDMRFQIVALAEYNDWVLVLNTQFVVGGYNRKTGQIVGEGGWDELPFTVRIYSGKIVALNIIDSDENLLDSFTPLHFPLIIDPVMQMQLAVPEAE